MMTPLAQRIRTKIGIIINTSSETRIDGDKTNSTTNTAKRQEEVKEAVGNTVTQTQEQINSNLNKSLQEAQKIFKAYNKDKYNDKLFDKVIEVANSLGVRYWVQSNPKWVNGTYTYYLNRAMIDTKLFMFDQKEIAPTLLHELIHSTTSRALHLYDNGHKELLSKAQQEAIAELKDIYTLITSKNKDKQWISYADTKTEAFKNQNRIYGLKNEHEMLAELSNKDFRDFLKEQNIFVKIINAIKKFFGIEEKQADSISTNAFKELEQSLYKIIDNYDNPQHFTSEFDRIYNIENFVDFDNYRKYIKDNYERFKEFKKPRDYYTHSDTPYAILVDDMFQKYNLDGVFEFRDTPLGEKLFEISKDKDKLGNILAIIEPFFKNNLQSTLSKEYVDNLLKNINEIKNKKNLIYNKKPVNDFFVSEYVLKEVEKLQHAQNALVLESKFLNNKGEIDFKTLESEAVKLPEALKFSDFKESILQSQNAKPQSNNKVSYKTIIGDININLGYTYSHFLKNGNGKENRFNLTGALTHILDNPLFVTKDKGSYYFYKPFRDEKGFKHLVSISVDKNGKIEYRTSYEASNARLKQMIKIHELVYLKE